MIVQEILGRSKLLAQGNTTRKQPSKADIDSQLLEVPDQIMNCYKNIELLADVLHINNMSFLTSISEDSRYGAISALDNLKCNTLEHGLKYVRRAYAIRGFNIIVITLDMQFKALKDENLVGMQINVASLVK